MTDRVISASDFKARCLALLDRVAETQERYVVTKYGEPVAMLVPLEPQGASAPLEGSVTILVSDEELVYGPAEEWDAEKGILVRE